MNQDGSYKPLIQLANVFGIVMALAALGIVGRFALLLMGAFQGHPRLIG